MKDANPFPGLRTFEADESHLFFGREVPTDELLRKLRTNRFIAVVGTSGSGKSSLVRAGMLPDLYGGFMTSAGSSWRVAVLRPGDAPIHALSQALTDPTVFGSSGETPAMETPIVEIVLQRGALGLVDITRQARMAPGENLLVVVDQFEELFRFKQSAITPHARDEAAAFVKLLLEATDQDEIPIYVVITMRSEYLGDCTQFRDLPEAINAGQYLIPRMTRDQRRQAITGPVAVGGAELTPRLIQRLLNDVGDNPDQLPILQHAMMRTWDYWASDHQAGEAIDLHHYEATGGMAEALSRHADEAYNDLADDASKAIVEKLFKRLTGRGSDNREMRYPTRLGELCAVTGAEEKQIIDVIEVYRQEGRSFLMPPPSIPLNEDVLIDISHESLIRIWDRLKRWVDEEAQSARIYRRLADTAALYNQGEAGLWRDPDLQIALSWQTRNDPTEAWARRYNPGFTDAITFLGKSHSSVRRRRALAMTPIIVLPLLLVGGGVYLIINQWQQDLQAKQELEEEIGDNVAILNQLQNDKEELRAEKQEILQKQLVDTAAEFNALGAEQRGKQKLQEQVSKTIAKLDELTVEKHEKEELKEELSETVDELNALLAQKEQDLVGKLKATANELTEIAVEEQQAESVTSEALAQLNTTDSGDSNAGAANQSDDPLNTQPAEHENLKLAINTSGETSTFKSFDSPPVAEATALEAHSDADSSIAKEKFAKLEASDKNGSFTVTQQLNRWENFYRDTNDSSVKATVKSKIDQLQDIVVSSAIITSADNFLVSRKMEGLKPVGIATKFPPGRIYVFARIHAPADETLKLVWSDIKGKEIRKRDLKIKMNTDNGFRTFSYKTFKKKGSYVVRLHNQNQYLIGVRKFTIE